MAGHDCGAELLCCSNIDPVEYLRLFFDYYNKEAVDQFAIQYQITTTIQMLVGSTPKFNIATGAVFTKKIDALVWKLTFHSCLDQMVFFYTFKHSPGALNWKYFLISSMVVLK